MYEEQVEFPPAILPLLKNNAPLSRLGQQTAAEFRKAHVARLEQIRLRTTRIQTEIADLQRERDELEVESKYHLAKLQECNALLSPIRRLPYDVIWEIAQYTLSEHPCASVSQSPLNLCQTSSVWRSAVLALPQLWTTLHTKVRVDGSSMPWRRASQQVVTFFERARDLPLSLYLFFEGDVEELDLSDDDERELETFAGIVSRFSSGMRRLGLGGDPLHRILTSFCSEAPEWDLSSLEHLHFLDDKTGTFDPGDCTVPMTLVDWASNPITFSFTGSFVKNIDLDDMWMDWDLLTELRFTEDLKCDDLKLLFALCDNLKVAEFHVGMESNVATGVQPPYKLEDLAIVAIGSSGSVVELLSNFHLTALKTLRLAASGAVHLSPPHPSLFAGFADLRRLFIDDSWRRQPSYMIDVLRQCTVIEELAFTCCPREFTPVFEAMTWPSATESSTTITGPGACVLPTLRIIQVQAAPFDLWERFTTCGSLKGDLRSLIYPHLDAMTVD